MLIIASVMNNDIGVGPSFTELVEEAAEAQMVDEKMVHLLPQK